MVSHTWKKLDSFPLAFVVVFAVAIFLPCIIALINGHVSPYVPYISEGGGLFPEAGIFSVCISISTILSQWIMCLRYLVVEHLISKTGYDINTFFNKISFALGAFSSIAMLLVAAYPASTISQVHNSSAGAACVCYVLYLVFQTWITFRILGRTKLSYWRLVITVFTALAVIFVTTFGVLGSFQWTEAYWAGKKTPKDKGFAFYVVSATSEWIMAILLMIFFSTYISEFKKSSFKFQLEIGDQTQNRPRLTNIDLRHP